jgi:hypothetical protein
MSAILSQVRRDSVGAPALAQRDGRRGIGLVRSTRLPHRGDVIDVDVQPLVGCSHVCPKLRSHRSHPIRLEIQVKRTFALALLVPLALAACSQATTTSTGSVAAPAPGTVGTNTARAALDQFLDGVKSQDIQAMSQVWGTSKGPAREQIPRQELEKRILVMQCYFSHDNYRVTSDSRTEKGHIFRVALTKGSVTRETSFYTVRGPSNRWFVENAEMEPVKDLCRQPPTPPQG